MEYIPREHAPSGLTVHLPGWNPGHIWESAMDINKRRVGDIAILDLQGKLTMNHGAELLRDTVTSIVFQGDRKVVLNLGGVPYMDSGGLGELVRCHLIVQREKGGAIKLANLTSKITDLLTITRLVTIFDTFDSEQAALASFGDPNTASAPVTGPS